MTLSIADLAQARDVVTKILEELKLDAFLFDVEPHEGQWEIKVECAVESDLWETFDLTAKLEYLLRGSDDAVVHQLLLDNWQEALCNCKKKQ